MEILDMKCAEYGEKIGREVSEDLIRKALGVLQEDGVYAFFIYLCSRGGEEGLSISKESFKFLKERGIFNAVDSDPITKFNEYSTEQNKEEKKKKLATYVNTLANAVRSEIANDFDKLLLAKELLERTLIYARYHAKALEKTETTATTEGGGE